jgi:RNA polymerase sigma factor (sigma-70 family)
VTAEAVQHATGLSADDARLMLHELPRAVSLDAVLDELGDEQMHDLTDRYNAVAEPELLGYDVEDVHRALFLLSEREQLVMRRRSGLIGSPATLEEIGQEFGLTRERIRQIESKARAKVATSLRGIRPPVLRAPSQAACGS